MMVPSERLRQELEVFSPSWLRDERNKFYPKLRQLTRGIPVPVCASDKIADGYTFVLAMIWTAYLQSESQDALKHRTKRTGLARSRAKLSKEQEQIEQTLQALQGNRNVRLLYWELYEPAEVVCSHGRDRKKCESLSAERTRLLQLNQAPLRRYISGYLADQKEQYGHLLAENADNFCEPPCLPPTPLPLGREGKPKDELADFLMKEIVEWLVKSGKTVAEAVRLLCDVLRFFFGCRTNPQDFVNLKKRYYRLGLERKYPRRPSSQRP